MVDSTKVSPQAMALAKESVELAKRVLLDPTASWSDVNKIIDNFLSYEEIEHRRHYEEAGKPEHPLAPASIKKNRFYRANLFGPQMGQVGSVFTMPYKDETGYLADVINSFFNMLRTRDVDLREICLSAFKSRTGSEFSGEGTEVPLFVAIEREVEKHKDFVDLGRKFDESKIKGLSAYDKALETNPGFMEIARKRELAHDRFFVLLEKQAETLRSVYHDRELFDYILRTGSAVGTGGDFFFELMLYMKGRGYSPGDVFVYGVLRHFAKVFHENEGNAEVTTDPLFNEVHELVNERFMKRS